ncbi:MULTISPECIES: hypothetical protein [unclassified Pseudomonas]|uniref:hypothetical protein n=1 Tax=unclassified Pseudomonas TaxID=196821 RepID=UPI000F560916|nr:MULTISPECIES: hypothetical protein [unclassified Pseudomonas]AZF48727.1 hypothetical protein C4J86_3508 [Pseudomonas sp. R2-7-07]AZF59223.1 hypothetical protein C4J84_3362 [Pseudomonas sp. R11-23-07]
MSDMEKMDKHSKSTPGKHEPVTLSAGALFAKSRVFAHRALKAKDGADNDVFQMWAALALELLAKASLAKIHPSLVVDAVNPNSLLEACGFNTNTVVRTVDANVVFARLKHTVPNFGTPNAEACKRISARRNAELHSGHAAFSGMPLDAWEGEFWSAAQLILISMGLDLEAWVGAESQIPLELLRHFRDIKAQAARHRIADAKATFVKDHTKKDQEALQIAARSFNSVSYLENFRYSLDHHWEQTCPACTCTGFLGGDRADEEVIDQDFGSGYETVNEFYSPMEFYCPTCQLHLEGEDALDEAGLSDEYSEESEREMEYEPEYGND